MSNPVNCNLRSGVSQGSILGPLFLIPFLHPSVPKYNKLIFYAGDILLYSYTSRYIYSVRIYCPELQNNYVNEILSWMLTPCMHAWSHCAPIKKQNCSQIPSHHSSQYISVNTTMWLRKCLIRRSLTIDLSITISNEQEGLKKGQTTSYSEGLIRGNFTKHRPKSEIRYTVLQSYYSMGPPSCM